MIKYQVEISEEDIPIGWSVEAGNFFNKLLIREPENTFSGFSEKALSNLFVANNSLWPALIGALYRDILSYIALFGGFCSSIMCYLLPGALMVITNDEKVTSKKNNPSLFKQRW